MTEDSLEAVRAALAEVSEQLLVAYRYARSAEQSLAEAAELLTELNQAHHEQLVPPELLRADQELTRGLGLISGGADSVAAIGARL
ncbi:MAG TPA: hypothetical protein VGH89_37015 [Pseudonocardia sp.]